MQNAGQLQDVIQKASQSVPPALLETFLDATSDAIVLLDRDYRITYLNRAAQSLLDPVGSILNTGIYESFPAAGEGSLFYSHYKATMEEGQVGEFEAFYPAPLNKWFHTRAHPMEDGIMIFFRDITAQRVSEETLKRTIEDAERQHAEIETLYRTAPIGLALFDLPDYHYLRLNDRQAAFFGLSPEQVVGRTLTEMAPIPGLRELFDQVARGEPVVNYPLEGTLINDPENYRYWLVSYYPVHAPDGSIQAITAASLEVTQVRKAEAALMQSEKLAVVGRLASSIAHEINNPLEAVTNLLFLSSNADTLEDSRKYIAMAERELRRAAAITTQTLRFHKQASSPQAVTGQQLLEGVLLIYHGRLSNSHTVVEERLRAVKPVRCFEGEIRQVVSNLVGNALDAMTAKGARLLVRTRETRNWSTGEAGIALTIADTGSGMSPETLRKLFKAFFTTKGMLGTGLGLWVSQEIVSRHRGTLRVRSSQSALHHGTVFVLFLPFEAATR